MLSDNAQYFRRREQQQRTLADRAADPAIRRIHLELAAHYAGRVVDTEYEQPAIRLAAIGEA